MSKPDRPEPDLAIARMVCPISAGMVGVCLTGIGLMRVYQTVSRTGTYADDLLSLDAILFLAATLTSYIALRSASTARRRRFERAADAAFIAAMGLLTLICLFMTYVVAH